MDKAGGSAVGTYINSLEQASPLFLTEMITRARTAMKENVKTAMKTFAMQDLE